MKLFKKVAISVLCIVALLVTCLATGCKPAETSKTIAVVAKGESHAFWQSVKAGAVAAGEKYGYKVTFQGAEQQSGCHSTGNHWRRLCGQPYSGV